MVYCDFYNMLLLYGVNERVDSQYAFIKRWSVTRLVGNRDRRSRFPTHELHDTTFNKHIVVQGTKCGDPLASNSSPEMYTLPKNNSAVLQYVLKTKRLYRYFSSKVIHKQITYKAISLQV